MANNGEISVELTLGLTKLKATATQAAKIINDGLKTNYPASLTSGVDARRQEQAERLRELREQGLRGFNIQQFYRNIGQNPFRQYPAPIVPNPQFQVGGRIQPVNPANPVNQPAQNGRSNLAPVIAAIFGTGIGGPVGGAIAGLLTKANPAVAAVTAVMTALRASVEKMIQAADQARKDYARSITSGFGIGGTVQRRVLSEVIGVSEDDIYQYGQAIAYLNPQLENAIKILTETNSPLTQLSLQFNILKENLAAMFAKITVEFQPELMTFVDNISILVKVLTDNADKLKKVYDVGKWINPLYDWYRFTQAAANTLYGVTQDQVDKQFRHGDNGKLPDPSAFIKQMPTSAWERLGLVVGASGGANYQQQIAASSKDAVAVLREILSIQRQIKPNSTSPQGLPSGA